MLSKSDLRHFISHPQETFSTSQEAMRCPLKPVHPTFSQLLSTVFAGEPDFRGIITQSEFIKQLTKPHQTSKYLYPADSKTDSKAGGKQRTSVDTGGQSGENQKASIRFKGHISETLVNFPQP
jgi:hypothetical protein